MPFLSHVHNLEKVYKVFDKHLAKEYPGEYSFIIQDYDSMVYALLRYINDYDYEPHADSFNNHYSEIDLDVPSVVLSYVTNQYGIPSKDVAYLVTLLAIEISHIPEELMLRAIGHFDQPHDCRVDIKLVSHANWMYSIS